MYSVAHNPVLFGVSLFASLFITLTAVAFIWEGVTNFIADKHRRWRRDPRSNDQICAAQIKQQRRMNMASEPPGSGGQSPPPQNPPQYPKPPAAPSPGDD